MMAAAACSARNSGEKADEDDEVEDALKAEGNTGVTARLGDEKPYEAEDEEETKRTEGAEIDVC